MCGSGVIEAITTHPPYPPSHVGVWECFTGDFATPSRVKGHGYVWIRHAPNLKSCLDAKRPGQKFPVC